MRITSVDGIISFKIPAAFAKGRVWDDQVLVARVLSECESRSRVAQRNLFGRLVVNYKFL